MSNVAIIVPEYNEQDLEVRLKVFDELGQSLAADADVIVVDDASTNGNRERLAEYVLEHNPSFRPYFMQTNGKKIGAIKSAVASLPEETDTVILTDIDSYLNITPKALRAVRDELLSSENLIGGTFRLKPANSKGLLGRLQTTEYETSRAMLRLLQKEGKSIVIPGASAIYRRKPLENLLAQHSGRHNGDDKELTILAIKEGWRFKYFDEVDVETIVPSKVSALFSQRARYTQGTLETYEKEFPAYFKEALTLFKGKRFGLITALQIKGTIAFPLGIYALAKTVADLNFEPLIHYGMAEIGISSAWLLYARKEIDNKLSTILTVPLLPAYKMAVLTPARAYGFLKYGLEGMGNLLPNLPSRADLSDKIDSGHSILSILSRLRHGASSVAAALSRHEELG